LARSEEVGDRAQREAEYYGRDWEDAIMNFMVETQNRKLDPKLIIRSFSKVA
jgi:hypothetical protein